MAEKEPIKITLDDLDPEEVAAKPEATGSTLQDQAGATGRQVAGAAKGLAGKVSDKLSAGAADATNRTAEIAREKMGGLVQEQSKAIADALEQRVREIDWQGEAQKGAEGGLRWLGRRLTELADRMKSSPTESTDTPTDRTPKP